MSQIRSETRQFSFDELQPGKTYRAVVRAFDAENKRIGRSATIEFKTNAKDTAPPPVTNLTGSYDGSTLQVSWGYDVFPNDFSEFIVNVSGSPSQGDYYPSDHGTFSSTATTYSYTIPPKPSGSYNTFIAIYNIPGQSMPDPQQIEALYPPDFNNLDAAIQSLYPSVIAGPKIVNNSDSSTITNSATLTSNLQNYTGDLWAVWSYGGPTSVSPLAFISMGFEGANLEFSPEGSSAFDTSRTQSFTLGYNELLTLFQSVPTTIYVNVVARDRSRNQSTPVEISITAESLDDPTNVTAEASIAGYNVSWDEVETPAYNYTRIYESNTVNGTYQVVYTSATTPVFVPSTNYTERFIKVSHVNDAGLETNLVASAPTSVTPINPNVLDTTPPDNRENILFTAGVGEIIASWTNPTNENNNSDIAGVVIRYAETSSPSDYTWVNIPFTFSETLTSTKISGLLPNTSYDLYLATYDRSQNFTDYSLSQSVVTLSDSTPPPAPKAPVVAGGAAAGGPFIIRVTQESIENGTSSSLPIDTSYFKVFMLNSGESSSPGAGMTTDDLATEIGTLVAAFNGGESQSNFYVPLIEGEQRYFYTRAVDTSSNISDASPASQSSPMIVIDNAYISDLSADKITAGRLNADQFIQVGTSSNQITIGSTSTLGRIYSGAGNYGSDDIYIDTTGKFSLKDRLTFDGTNLTISGTVNASGGLFTGNVGIGQSGGIYIGSSTNSGARIVLNNTSIGGYSSDTGNPQTFLFTTSGVSNISGWSITPTTIEKTSGTSPNLHTIKLDSGNNQITAGSGNNTVGIKSQSLQSSISLWAGTESPSTSSPFYVTNTGRLVATNAEITGLITGSTGIFTGELSPSGISLTYDSTETRTPTITIDSGSGATGGSYLSFLRRSASNEDSAIEFFVEAADPTKAFRRGRVSHDTGGGGEFNITAYPSSTGDTPGILKLNALDGTTQKGTVTITGDTTIDGNLTVTGTGGGGGTGSGSVTSVGFSAPDGFNVINSPITDSGTIGLTYSDSPGQYEVFRTGSGSNVSWGPILGNHIDTTTTITTAGFYHNTGSRETWYGGAFSGSSIPDASTFPANSLIVIF